MGESIRVIGVQIICKTVKVDIKEMLLHTFFHFLNKVYIKAEENQEKNAIFNNFYQFIK